MSVDNSFGRSINRAYCVNIDGATVIVIEGVTNRVIDTVPVGGYPYILCYDPEFIKVYCANAFGYVHVMNGETSTILRRIDVPVMPVDLCHNPQHSRVYAANSLGSSVSVLRDTDGGIEGSHKLQVSSSRPAAAVVRGLPKGAVVFDAMGRRVATPNPACTFVREESGVKRAGRA